MAPSASRPLTPAAAAATLAVSSRIAAMEMSRLTSSSPLTCLYRPGRDTPQRCATAASVSRSRPTSSATTAASVMTRCFVSPARGMAYLPLTMPPSQIPAPVMKISSSASAGPASSSRLCRSSR